MRGRINLKALVVMSVIWPVLVGGTGVAAAGPLGTWEGSWPSKPPSRPRPFTWVLGKLGSMTGTWEEDLARFRLSGTATVTVSGTYVYNEKSRHLGITASGTTILENGYTLRIDLAADGTITFDSASGTSDIEYRLFQGKLLVAEKQEHASWSAGRSIIVVTSPNGGEGWEAGTDHEITWTTNDSAASKVGIDLYKGGSYDSKIITSTANDGSHSWTVPLKQAEGYDYKVKIKSILNPSCYDYSDSDFSIFRHRVNLREFAVFAGHWMESDCGYCGGADLTGDGEVRIDDLGELLAHYSELPGPEDQPEEKHWDFEDGTLQGWVATGNAFSYQPTYGNNVSTSRAKQNDSAFLNRINDIGGDYWDGPCPIGIQGEYWIGTYENRPRARDAWGSLQGDWPVGSLFSPEFTLGKKYIHFLIGGGAGGLVAGIELQVKVSSGGWVHANGTRTGGKKDERLERVVVDLAALGLAAPDLRPDLLGRLPKARLHIYDHSSGPWGHISPWGHINIDDVWVTDDYPDDVGKKPPVWGFADTHTHLAARMAYEGRLMWGCTSDLLADGTYSIPTPGGDTTDSCPGLHFCQGTAHTDDGTSGFSASKFIYALEDQLTFGRVDKSVFDTNHTRRNLGTTTWYSLTHQQMYEKWLYRAYKGGLRLLVAEAINNRVVAWAIKKGPSFAQTDPDSYKEQIDRIHEIVDRNNKWMEIALDPAHARRIIQANKLAVVIGIEVDSFAGCDRKNLPPGYAGCCWYAGTSQCNTFAGVRAKLRELYEDYDVRQLHPIHLTDNGFGGAAVYNDTFNIANHYLNGEFFAVSDGSASGVDWEFKKEQEQITENIAARQPGPWHEEVYGDEVDDYSGHINKKGLTAHGRDLLKEMMKLGMIIAVDHMSDRALNELIGLRDPVTNIKATPLVAQDGYTDLSDPTCLEKAYPVALTHTSARALQFRNGETISKAKLSTEGAKSSGQIRQINLIGGISAPGICAGHIKKYRGWAVVASVANDCAGSSGSFAQLCNYISARAADIHGLDFGMPIGTDFNGLAGGAVPRYGKWGCWKRNGHFSTDPSPDAGNLNHGHSYDDTAFNIAFPDVAEQDGSSDYDQRLIQIEDRKGVNYDFYNASPGSFVLHTARLRSNWIMKTPLMYMYVEASQPALKAEISTSGARWDINFDVVAHYGMLPDFFQDLRALGASKESMGPLFLGAEAYIRMWEKAWELRDSPRGGN